MEIPPRKAMVMAGENTTNDVNEEVYGNDGAERREAQEASAGDRRGIAESDQAGQLDISGETKTARILRTPEPPTDAARMAHNATHVPFRDWCPICVASRGRSSPHRRVVVNKTADTLPKFRTDYMFIRTVAESKTQSCITFVETRSGVLISFMCARKGGYEDLTKEILRHFEAYDFLNPVIIQCDKEMSVIDVCRKVARKLQERTNDIYVTMVSWEHCVTSKDRTFVSSVTVTDVTYLGFEYRSVHDGDRRGFTVKPTAKYVDECLDIVQLQNAKAVMTPLTEQKSLNLHDVTTVCDQVQHSLFRAVVGNCSTLPE